MYLLILTFNASGGGGGCGHVPQLCFLPVGALLSCSLTGPRAVSFQIHGLLDISSPSPELHPSLAWQRAGNTQAQGLKRSQGESWALAGGRAGDEGGRPQRAPEQHWKESSDALAHTGMLPGLALRCYCQQLWGCRKPGEWTPRHPGHVVGTADHGLGFHSGSNCPSKG